MPGITQQNHIIIQGYDEWMERAKKRDKEERIRSRQRGFKNKFRRGDGLEWAGYMLEYAVEYLYPHLVTVSSKYGIDKKDFVSLKTNMRYDTKLTIRDKPFHDNFNFYINDSQVKDGIVNYYIIGYFNPQSPFLRVCGYLPREAIEHRGALIKKGNRFNPRYKTTAKSDCWQIPFTEMTSMSSFIG